MPNSKVFCAIPWFEINVNQDGSYDLCGCQNDKIMGTDLGQVYNIKKINIVDYWNSNRLTQSRLLKLGNDPDPMCLMCQEKDRVGYDSVRAKELKKSVIFVDNFERSYQQSPNKHHFDYSVQHNGLAKTLPRSLHINLGATCNFACRMCGPRFSTKLQQEFKQLKWIDKDTNFDHWTDDATGWANFTDYLHNYSEHIHVVHIIGGECAFIPKFRYLVDHFADGNTAGKINFSFTSNGSRTYEEYFEQLSKYKRVEIGLSIEGVGAMNDYIRQGGNTEQTLKNIEFLKNNKPANTQLVLRTVPGMLSLPDYHELIKWAWDIGIPIDNSLLVHPNWQHAALLPDDIKQDIVYNISTILKGLPDIQGNEFKNQKDPNKIGVSMRNECEGMISLAKTAAPANADELRKICAERLGQWDRFKGINIKQYSNKLYNFLTKYGYIGA